ncbi:MAG TPA: putative baseplate assembly protein [Roseiflexaceae bacterium]|nr:putative baseplate assembly protein [Roseiflexaceae bacterium]
MSVPVPNLDDRTFQELVDEAKRRIPHYTPEWTDHNVSDPGVTLIELFAGMVETMIYRLNRVPEKHYRTFMSLMGLKLEPPHPAKAELTFVLATPREEPVEIPAGTEVETRQTAGQAAIRFSTDTTFVVHPPRIVAVLTAQGEQVTGEVTRRATAHEGAESFPAFGQPARPKDPPRPGAALLLGFEQDLSGHVLGLDFVLEPVEGIGIDPDRPPLVWEAWCGSLWGWQPIEAEDGIRALHRWHGVHIPPEESDRTRGLNQSGRWVLYLPKAPRPLERAALTERHAAYWVRCRYDTRDGRPGYKESPRVRRLSAVSLGGVVTATHATTVLGEELGLSNGQPGQVFYVHHRPLLPRNEEQRRSEYVEVQDGESGQWERWEEREHFGDSRAGQQHYVVDDAAGAVIFGPRIRHPDGSERQHGAVPKAGSRVRFARYRTGGGALTVGPGTIDVLKTAVPFVDWVVNRTPATGGLDAETVAHAQLRAPQVLRSSVRAVTAEDFVYHAKDDPDRQVARAHCLAPGRLSAPGGAPPSTPPGALRVLIVPRLDRRPDELVTRQELTDEALRPLLRRVQERLDQRRLLTAVVQVEWPRYVEVQVTARLRTQPQAVETSVAEAAARKLLRFLNPLHGGPQGDGWPFGRALYLSDIYNQLQGLPGLDQIEEVIIQADTYASPPPEGSGARGAAAPPLRSLTISSADPARGTQVPLEPDELIVSRAHVIRTPNVVR